MNLPVLETQELTCSHDVLTPDLLSGTVRLPVGIGLRCTSAHPELLGYCPSQDVQSLAVSQSTLSRSHWYSPSVAATQTEGDPQ